MAQSLLKGMEGVFIPVKDPDASAKWYEEKLGCIPLFVAEEAVTMRISDESSTVICLVRVENHQPMTFPEWESAWNVPVLNGQKGQKAGITFTIPCFLPSFRLLGLLFLWNSTLIHIQELPQMAIQILKAPAVHKAVINRVIRWSCARS